MRALITAVATAVVVGLLAPAAAAAPAPAPDRPSSPSRLTAGAPYLVTVQQPGDLAAVEQAARHAGAGASRRYRTAVAGFAARMDASAAARLARRPGVTVVPDTEVRASALPGRRPWGLDRVDQRHLPLNGAFTTRRTGRGVTAYVLDSGVRSDHAELEGRVLRSLDAVPADSGSGDCNGHGTHVAGTLAGRTVGVAPQATVVPVRVLACGGSGRVSDVLAGIDLVVRDHVAGRPAVANLSLGGARNPVLDAAVQALVDDGVTVVVAAGNSGGAACRESPAAAPAALTVAATGPTDRAADWSNQGACVDLLAPGVAVRSAWHTGSTALRTLDGTSMAAPHVAGAAALLLEAEPTASPSRVDALLRARSTTGVVLGLRTGTPDRLLNVGVPGTKVAPTTDALPGVLSRVAARTG